jgi:hypothetical protein
MAGESLWMKAGGARYPLQAHDVSDSLLSLQAIDPALAVFAGLLKAAIEAELGTTDGGWQKVAAALPSGHRQFSSTAPVGSVWVMSPSATAIRQIGVTWPLLAVWREGVAQREQRTMMREQNKQRWEALWSLGDIEDDLGLKLGSILGYVANLMANTISAGKHPAYDSGTQQYGEGRGDLAAVYPVEMNAGRSVFPDDEEAKFWGASLTFETIEMVTELDEGADDFTGVLTVGVGDELEILPALVSGDPDYPGTE